MKWRFPFPLFSIGLLLWSCSPATPRVSPPASALPTAASTSTVAAPTMTPSGEAPCAFVWATRDLPDLSERLAKELRALGPAATGSAYAYGEDCVAADGTRTFSAMETDFQIQVAVRDLSDKEGLGNWIAKVMAVILGLPPSDLQGPRAGTTDFEFRTPNSDSRRLTVNMEEFKSKSSGLTGVRLFEMLDSAP